MTEIDYKEVLLNVLAVIHRDGGHYVDAHGVEKAVSDAVDKFYQAPCFKIQKAIETVLEKKDEWDKEPPEVTTMAYPGSMLMNAIEDLRTAYNEK